MVVQTEGLTIAPIVQIINVCLNSVLLFQMWLNMELWTILGLLDMIQNNSLGRRSHFHFRFLWSKVHLFFPLFHVRKILRVFQIELNGFVFLVVKFVILWWIDGIHLQRAIPPLIFNTIPKDILAGVEYLIACLPCNSLFTSTPPTQERLCTVLDTLKQWNKESSSGEVFLSLNAMDQADLLPEEVLAGISTLLSQRVYSSSLFYD